MGFFFVLLPSNVSKYLCRKNKDMALKIDKVTLQFEIKPNYDANYSSINFLLKNYGIM